MSVNNQENDIKARKPVSVYQQLSGILNALKSEEMTINDVMNKIQLKEQRPERPYCKVTSNGALALHGITQKPITLYADQWNKLLRFSKTNYIENYIKYNESRLKFKKYNNNNGNMNQYQNNFKNSSQFNDDDNEDV
jgi:hypothetical protein